MSKTLRSLYRCLECGGGFPKWAGQCPDCGAWNTLEESVAPTPPRTRRSGGYAGHAVGAEIAVAAAMT